jgi:hypothetical protein
MMFLIDIMHYVVYCYYLPKNRAGSSCSVVQLFHSQNYESCSPRSHRNGIVRASVVRASGLGASSKARAPGQTQPKQRFVSTPGFGDDRR